MRSYANNQGCQILVLGPWASVVATDTHLAQCASLDSQLPEIGKIKRRFSYYRLRCPDADRIDSNHFTDKGAAQLLASGLGKTITNFIKSGKITQTQ